MTLPPIERRDHTHDCTIWLLGQPCNCNAYSRHLVIERGDTITIHYCDDRLTARRLYERLSASRPTSGPNEHEVRVMLVEVKESIIVG